MVTQVSEKLFEHTKIERAVSLGNEDLAHASFGEWLEECVATDASIRRWNGPPRRDRLARHAAIVARRIERGQVQIRVWAGG